MSNGYSQCITLEVLGRNIYFNYPVSFHFAHESYPCDSIIVFTEDAELKQSGCNLTIRAKNKSWIIFDFLIVRNRDTIPLCRRSIPVKEYLPFKIMLAGKTGGELGVNELNAQRGFRIDNELDIPVKVNIKSLSMIIYRNDKLLAHSVINSNIFGGKEIELLRSLLPRDRLLFSNVIAETSHGELIIVDPAEFIVK